MKARHNRTAARFANLNFHDDNLLLLEIYPPEKKASESRIDIHFRDYATCVTKVLSFRGRGNIRYVIGL